MKSFRSKSDHNPEKDSIEEFVAAIKLVSGEEILGKVIVDYSCSEEKVVIDNPLICHEVRSYGANVPMGYKFEPWMKMTDDDTFVVGLEKIITISEIKDDMVIQTYEDVIEQGFKRQHPDISKDMGYVNSVKNSRSILDKLYEGPDASKEPKEPKAPPEPPHG
tara:strand:- start:574 stop:1062 length:489 start_codon:yes stop_codon:yes gene_type:complete